MNFIQARFQSSAGEWEDMVFYPEKGDFDINVDAIGSFIQSWGKEVSPLRKIEVHICVEGEHEWGACRTKHAEQLSIKLFDEI